jgi:VanZ family protein
MDRYQIVARGLAWIGIIAIIILSVVPANQRPTPAEYWFGPFLGNLIEHVAAFALIAAAFAIGYRFSLLRLLTLGLLYCAAIELLQIPLPTRHARLSDFFINFAAAAAAMVVVESLHGHRRKKHAMRRQAHHHNVASVKLDEHKRRADQFSPAST